MRVTRKLLLRFWPGKADKVKFQSLWQTCSKQYMDRISIPDRLEPVAPTENTPRQSLTPDQRRRKSPRRPASEAKGNDADALPDEEEPHKIDEQV